MAGDVRLYGASWAAASSPLVAALAVALGAAVNGVGQVGATLAGWSGAAAVPPAGARVLVMEMGGNTSHPSPAQVTQAHAKLTRNGADVRWVLPPGWPRGTTQQATTADRRAAMRRAILDAGVPSVAHRWTATPSDLADYAHLSRAGAAAFAAAIVAAMKPRGPWLGLAIGAVALVLAVAKAVWR